MQRAIRHACAERDDLGIRGIIESVRDDQIILNIIYGAESYVRLRTVTVVGVQSPIFHMRNACASQRAGR
eukprot:1273345-Pleurochrysis_carterae.AAC.1